MSHPEFVHIGSIEDKVVEECAELIKSIMKAKRFGYFNYNPLVTPSTKNIDNIISEMIDVRDRLKEYDNFLSIIQKNKEKMKAQIEAARLKREEAKEEHKENPVIEDTTVETAVDVSHIGSLF